MNLYSSHGCRCFLCTIVPNRGSCTCSRRAPSTLLPSGCTYALATTQSRMKVWHTSKVSVLYGCFLPFVQPLFHVCSSSPAAGYNSHFFFEFNSSRFLDIRCSLIRHVLPRSTCMYTGRLAQSLLKCSPRLISTLEKSHPNSNPSSSSSIKPQTFTFQP